MTDQRTARQDLREGFLLHDDVIDEIAVQAIDSKLRAISTLRNYTYLDLKSAKALIEALVEEEFDG